MSEGGITIDVSLDKSQLELDLSSLKDALAGMGELFDMANVVGNMQTVAESIGGIGDAVVTMKDELNGGTDIAAAFEAVSAAAGSILEHASEAAGAVENIGNTIMSAFGEGGVVNKVKEIGENFRDMGKNIADVVKNSRMFDVLKSSVERSKTAFKEAGAACRDLGKSILESIKNSDGFQKAQGLVGKLGDAVKSAGAKVLEFGKGILNAIKNSDGFRNVQSIVGKVGDVVKSAGAKVLEFGKGILTAIKNSSGFQAVQGLISKVGNALKSSSVMQGLWTAAQKIFNATLNSCPIWLLVTVIAAVVAGIAALCAWLSKGSDELKKQKEEIKELVEAQEEYLDSLDEAEKKHNENVKSTKAQAVAGDKLVDQLGSLVDAEGNLIAKNGDLEGSKKELLNTVEMLNDLYPDLNLKYDEQTGKLNLNKDAVRELADAHNELALAQVYQDRYVALLSEEAGIQEELAVTAKKKRDYLDAGGVEWGETWDSLVAKENEFLEAQDDNLIKQEFAYNRMMEMDTTAANTVIENDARMRTSSGETVEEIANQYGVSAEKINKYLEDENNSLDGWIDQYKAAVDEAGSASDVYLDAQGKAMIRATEDLAERLDDTADATGAFTDNVNGSLSSIDFSPLVEEAGATTEVVDTAMNTAGEALAGSTALQDGARTMMEGLTNVIIEGMENEEHVEAAKTMAQNLGAALEESTDIKDGTETAIENAKTAAQTAAKSEDWANVGKSIIDGMASGIKNNVGVLSGAMAGVVSEALAAAKKAGEIESPSKLFEREIGMMISSGTARGIEKGTPMVKKTAFDQMIKLAADMRKTAGPDITGSLNIASNVGAPNVTAAAERARLMEQNALLREQVKATLGILRKDWAVNVDGRQLAIATNKANREMGPKICKGPFADAY